MWFDGSHFNFRLLIVLLFSINWGPFLVRGRWDTWDTGYLSLVLWGNECDKFQWYQTG